MTQAIRRTPHARNCTVIRRSARGLIGGGAAFMLLTAVAVGQYWPSGPSAAQAAETVPTGAADPLLSRAALVGGPNVGGETVAAVAAELATASGPAAPTAAALIWQGTAGQDGYVRAAPSTKAARLGDLKAGQPVQVVDWVSGEEVETENTTWADLGNGRYVYSSLLRSRPLDGPPAPPPAPTAGRWIDVNLTLQVATAYEGTTPVKSVLISSGRPGWATSPGTFPIQRRVASETMDGSTLVGQGPNGKGASYKVENVRWTQYFTADGSAIHENYWRNPALFGMPGSHGCIGMRTADAAWFWDWATIGTPVVVH